jgi:hypothetical protein
VSFWRIFTAVVVALVIAGGIQAFFADDDRGGDGEDDDFVEAESDDEALSVLDAINRNPGVSFAVRGWVYDDGSFVQLCQGLYTEGEPRCRGPVLLLKNLDLARLDLEAGEWNGNEVRYTDEPVILGGTIDGTQLSVVEILSSAP